MEIYGLTVLLTCSLILAMIKLVRCERDAMTLFGKREQRLILVRAQVRAKYHRNIEPPMNADQDNSPPIIWTTNGHSLNHNMSHNSDLETLAVARQSSETLPHLNEIAVPVSFVDTESNERNALRFE